MSKCYAGTKAELMTRILQRFNLSHPCSAPLQLVAHTNAHALRLLRTVHGMAMCITDSPGPTTWKGVILRLDQYTSDELRPHVRCPSPGSKYPAQITAVLQKSADELAHIAAVAFQHVRISSWFPCLDDIAAKEV